MRQRGGFGQGSHSISELPAPGPAELKRIFASVFAAKDFQPPVLPAAAGEIMALSKRPNVSFDDVERVVEKDATIAGKVLQAAQSPIYATRVKAKTLRDAVTRLGLSNIRDIVWQVSVNMKVFRVPAYADTMDRLQLHSAATAHIARVVCGYTSVASDYAFLCGLLHDVGLGGLLIALSHHSAAGGHPAPPAIHDLWPALEEVHPDASKYMARLWELEADVQFVLAEHHNLHRQAHKHPLCAVVRVAERYARMHDLDVCAASDGHFFDLHHDDSLGEALTALQLDETKLKLIGKDVERVTEALRQ